MVNDEILKIAEAIKNAVQVEKIYLFGSYAYGTPNKDSDYDFYLTIPKGGIRPLDASLQARMALFDVERDTPIDILADYQESFDERKEYPTLERKIFNEGVMLYEQV